MEPPGTMIRYVFLHLDGVVLQNILAPVILSLVRKLGGKYSAELENNVFSRSQTHAAHFLIKALNLQLSVDEVIALYNETRKDYILANTIRPSHGLKSFLNMLKTNGYKIVAYGGADREYFLANVGDFRDYFDDDGYIQTRDIRPGVRQIIREIYRIDFGEALFMDDTVAVARAAKDHNVPFIGMSTEHTFSFQKKGLERLGVKYLVHSLCDVDLSFMTRLQQAALRRAVWK